MLIFLDHISPIFEGIILYIYFQTMFKKRKSNMPTFILLAGFVVAEYIFMFMTSFTNGNVSTGSAIYRSVLNMLVAVVLSLFYEASLFQRILVILFQKAFSGICEDIAFFIVNQFVNVKINQNELPEDCFFAIALISQLLQFFFIMVLHVLWRRKQGTKSLTYTLLLLLIPLFSIIFPMTPACYELNLVSPDSYAFIVMFMLLINIVNYILLENVLKAEDLEQKTRQLKEQITYQSRKYMQLGEAYRNIRSFMHDTKKHLFYIQECVNENNYERIIPYTKETINDLESRYCTTNTGNLVIDAFVSNLILQTARYGIELTTSLKVDCNRVPVDDYHLTIILGNMLDNALNACLEQHFGKINIMIQTVENTFTIHITNTCNLPEIVKHPEDIEEIDFIHGYGLRNVKDSVEACGGIILINYKNSIYSVTTIFPLKGDI